MRKEHDALGEMEMEAHRYYGIHTQRALMNFPIAKRPIHGELVKGLVVVKKAAATVNAAIGILDKDIAHAIVTTCDEILSGNLLDAFVTDAMQGGAGDAANMNANEVIANRAIEILGGQKGEYHRVHPLHHVNLSQSTNDVFPTAVRIAAIRLLKPVSELFAELQSALQKKEAAFSEVLKVGRTQLQDAVPIMLGQEFGAWAQAVARDRWRLYKAEERLRQVNIGGTVVGTGIHAEKKYVFRMIEQLRDFTGLGLARSEYMMDTTQNLDVYVEVAGLLKTAAVNLAKIAGDLRLLASGPKAGLGEIILPAVQAGSAIMPGKVNPVIPEAVQQVAYRIMGLEQSISIGAQAGQLELNPFLPMIADSLFEIMDLLRGGLPLFIERCIDGIQADKARCQALVDGSYVLVTVLAGYLGDEKASEVSMKVMRSGKTVRQVLQEEKLLPEEKLEQILNPLQMTIPGIPGK